MTAASPRMRVAEFRGVADVRITYKDRPEPGRSEALVQIVASGICGSDLHRYRGYDPWIGHIRFPRSGGHEMAGVVHALGPDANGFQVGQRVAIEPGQVLGCGRCACCLRGDTNLCTDRAAIPRRKASVGFAEFDVAGTSQLHKVPDGVPLEAAALADVYACAIHAVHRTAIAAGTNVVVIGTGPVGLALGQVVRLLGGKPVLIGRYSSVLKKAIATGAADDVLRLVPDPEQAQLGRLEEADVVFEAAGGLTCDSLRLAVALARPGGTLGVVGAFAGDVRLPYAIANRKELTVRFCNGYGRRDGHSEFSMALDLIGMGSVDALGLVTHRFPLTDIASAFRIADDKTNSGAIKVMLNTTSAACGTD